MDESADVSSVDLSIYEYPPGTPGAELSGFVFSLTSEQREVLRQTRQWLEEHELSASALSARTLHPDLTLLRYLRANKFSVEGATQHMARNVAWRGESSVHTLLEQDPEIILGCEMVEYQRYLPHWQCGFDRTGRPVIYKQYGSFENELLRDLSTIEAVTKYHVWEQEVVSQLCDEQSRKMGYIVETSFAIMDLEGMQIRQVTKDFLAIVKAFANIDQTQYPETLGKLMIINAPSAFPFVWGWVKPWLDPVVASKIQIFGGPATWQPVFFELIGKENMPANYGGTLPRLNASDAPYKAFRRPTASVFDQRARPLSAETMHRLDISRKDSQIANRRASFRRAPSLAHAMSGESVDGSSDRHRSVRSKNNLLLNLSSSSRASCRFSTATFRYPENTPGNDAPDGFVFTLTERQTTALKSVQQWMQEDDVDIGALVNQALHPNLILLRYLRANKFESGAAIVHMKKNIAWRRELNVDRINETSPETILGCAMAEYQRFLPHWQCGFDRTGRPVIYKQYGSFENELLRWCSLEAVTKYHVWEQETVCKICYEQSRKMGHIVETSFAIMDLEGMQIRQVTSDFLSIVKAFANIDQQQYPETLGKLMIINAPSVFPMVWRGVKSFLDPVVTSKIQIFGGPATWQPVFFELIGKENMPANYGGDLPALSAADSPYKAAMDCSTSRRLSLTRPASVRVRPTTSQMAEDDEEDDESVASIDFYDALEQQEVADVFNMVSRRENFLEKAAQSVFVFKALTDMDWTRLSALFCCSLVLYLVGTFLAMVLSAYAMHSAPWIEDAYSGEKWTAIIVVIQSFFLFMVIFIGFIGNLIKNFFLLDFFASSVGIGSLLYIIVSISAFSYLAAESAKEHGIISEYRKALAVGCLLLFLIGFGPIALSRALSYRCKVEFDKRLVAQQCRVVIRTISVVCMLFGMGMVVYGGVSMNFLFAVNRSISSTVYSVYGLIYCGVTIMLSATAGFWVSVTTRRNVVRFYYSVFVPLILLLLLASAITSFANINNAKRHSDADFKSGVHYSQGYVRATITTELTIAGILCIFCLMFQLLSLYVSVLLFRKLEEDHAHALSLESRFKYAHTLTVRKHAAARTLQENLLVVYGLVGGLFCIYFKGTFVIFADFVRSDSKTYTLNWLANPWFGGIDPRYAEMDPYIVSMEGTLALILGPLLLLYSWTTFVRAPFRHILGIVVSTAQLWNTFIYYGIEISHDFRDIYVRGEGVTAITIAISLLLEVLLPVLILVHECVILSRNSSKAYAMESSRRVRGLGRGLSAGSFSRARNGSRERNHSNSPGLRARGSSSGRINGQNRNGRSRGSETPPNPSWKEHNIFSWSRGVQVADTDDDETAGTDMTMTI